MSKLAQYGLYEENVVAVISGPEKYTVWANVFSMLLPALAVVAFFGLLVTWIIGLVQVIRRSDLKEKKILWIVLMIFLGMLGTIIYGFVEKRIKLAFWTIVFLLLPFFILSGWAIAQFVIASAAVAS